MNNDIIEAERGFNKLINEIHKNPSLVDDTAEVERIEKELENITDRLPQEEELIYPYYEKFYNAINSANEYLEAKKKKNKSAELYDIENNTGRNSGNEIINSKEFQDFYNGYIQESTIGKLLNHKAINEDIEDVKDIIVKIGTEYAGDTSIKNDYIYGGSTGIENGKVVIYTNTRDLSPEEVRDNLFHELQHARQRQAALDSDIEAQKELDKIKQALYEGNFEEYENSNYEKEAEFSKQFLLKKLEDYDNEANRKTNEGMGRSYELPNSDGRKNRNTDERRNEQTGSKKSSLGRTSTDSEEEIRRNRQTNLIEAAETVEDELEVPETVADKIIRGESKFGKLYTEWVDRYTPIENLVKKAEQKTGKKLDTSSNPYFQARIYAEYNHINFNNYVKFH